MKRLSALTVRYMVKNRKRTITTIVGVFLSTILIFLFYETAYSIKYSGNAYERHLNGGWDISFDVDAGKALLLRKDYREKHELAGIAVEKLWLNLDTFYSDIYQIDDFTEMEVPVRLTSGRLPQNSREVVWNGPNSNTEPAGIGDIISSRYYVDRESFSEDELDTLREKEKQSRINELKENGVPEDSEYYQETIGRFDESWNELEKIPVQEQFQVVGVADNEFMTWCTYTGLLPDEQLRSWEKDRLWVRLSVGNMSGLAETAEIIGDAYGIDPGSWKVTYDDTLPPNYGDVALEAFLLMITAVFAAVLMFVIRNGFNISVDERLKDYGLLRCIGLTRRQIFRMIRLEAFIVALIGVLIGILAGYVISLIVLPLHYWDSMLSAVFGRGFRITVIFSMKAVLITSGAVFLTTLVSMVSPVEKLFRLSPVEAGVRREEVKSHGKKSLADLKRAGVAVPYGIRSAKRTGGRFARTVVSFSLGLALVIGFGTFAKTVDRTELDVLYGYDTRGSVSALPFGSSDHPQVDLMDKWYAAKKELEAADSCEALEGLLLYTESEIEKDQYKTTLAVVGITSGIWEKLEPDIHKGDVTAGQDEIPVLRIINSEYPENGYQPGESFTVSHSEKKFLVVGSIQDRVLSRYTGSVDGAALPGNNTVKGKYIYQADEWQAFRSFERKVLEETEDPAGQVKYDTGMHGCLVVRSASGMEQENETLLGKYMDNVTGILSEDDPASVIRMIRIFIAAVLGALLLIMVVNMINVERGLVHVRRNEFRILRVIGMSEKQRRRILLSENLAASVLSAVIGTVLGLVFAACITKIVYEGNGLTGAFDPEYMKVRYTPDWIMILGAVGVVLAAGWLVAFLNRKDEAFEGRE